MWEIIKTSLPQLLAAGFKYTIPLAIISFFFGLIIALVTALIRLSRQRGAFSRYQHAEGCHYSSLRADAHEHACLYGSCTAFKDG